MYLYIQPGEFTTSLLGAKESLEKAALQKYVTCLETT